jgi:hypothetical protein
MRPPRRRQPHRAARLATSCSPRPPSASPPGERSSGVPVPARSVTSTRTMPPPALTATVTVSPGAPEPLCRTELPKTSLTSKTAASPHGCPGPSTSPTNVRAARARSARPASVTLSRIARPAITAPALPRPPRPGKPAGQRADAGKCTLSSAPNVKPYTGLRGPPSVDSSVPAAPVRGRPCKADGSPHRSQAPIFVRYTSVDTAT